MIILMTQRKLEFLQRYYVNIEELIMNQILFGIYTKEFFCSHCSFGSLAAESYTRDCGFRALLFQDKNGTHYKTKHTFRKWNLIWTDRFGIWEFSFWPEVK